MTQTKSRMRCEIEDIPATLQRLIEHSSEAARLAADAITRHNPALICTIARGSSDHAATYLKYAIELTSGIPVASIGPSISSIYRQQLKLEQAACITISQSGASPDIIDMTASAKRNGALTIALTNTPASPLAEKSAYSVDIQACDETSVAATKSYVASVVCGLMVLAHWTKNSQLLKSIRKLPVQARRAMQCDWSDLNARLASENALYVLGRGPTYAIASEVALKFKETCQIQAEAFSSAEVLHGPVAIVSRSFPVLALAARDDSEATVNNVADNLAARGGDVFVTSGCASAANTLPFVSSGHALTDPLLLAISFYANIEKLARQRGHNPDVPRHLQKVTQTV